jgi:hypothetical protein
LRHLAFIVKGETGIRNPRRAIGKQGAFDEGCNFGPIWLILPGSKNFDRIGIENAGGIHMAKLTYEKRKDLPKGDFVYPKTRRYPIEDAAHARDALARSSGKPEHAAVVAAVKRKFPEIEIEKQP